MRSAASVSICSSFHRLRMPTQGPTWMRGPLQPFVAEGMSSRELNNEDYFSDHPKRLPIFDALFRAQAQLSPDHFSRNLERRSGHHHCSQDDYQRAVFLFRRLQSACRTISKVLVFFLAMLLVPFVCLSVPEARDNTPEPRFTQRSSCINLWCYFFFGTSPARNLKVF